MTPALRLRSAAAAFVALASTGCASTGSGGQSGPDASYQAPPSVHWVRTPAEHRISFLRVYEAATVAVEGAASGVTEPWGVILDADETVLDNSLYQLERARLGLGYTIESWNDWVRREEAPLLPGALAFIRRVKELGGRVAIVTNRLDEVCAETRRNLTAEGVPFDVVLCRTDGSEKETRFAMVEEGATAAGLPPLRVLAWIGDNIEDFPGGEQGLRDVPEGSLQGFGTRYFVLPNPMYGSWTSNPVR